MATSRAREELEGEDVRHFCSLCLESYGDRTPKLLPCFHSFCLPCLTALVASLASAQHDTDPTEKADEGEGEGKGCLGAGTGETDVVFPCPTCQAAITVPDKGVAAFQTNFYIVTETASNSTTPLPCQMCDRDEDAKNATHTCDKCQQRMCQSCRRMHDRFTDPEEHTVRALTTGLLAQHVAMSSTKCGTHPDQDLCFFCNTCQRAICLKCRLTVQHQSHETHDLTTAAQDARKDVTGLVSAARLQIQALEKRASRLTQDGKELEREKTEVSEEVKSRCDELFRWLKRARDEVLETLSAKADMAAVNLKSEEAKVQTSLTSLTKLVVRSGCVSNDPQVLALRDRLQEALLPQHDMQHLHTTGDTEEQQTFFQLNSDPTALDLAAIRAFIGDLNMPGKRLAAISLTQKMEQSAKHVADLEARLAATEQHLQQALQDLQAQCQTAQLLETKMTEEIVMTKDQIKASTAALETQLQALGTTMKTMESQTEGVAKDNKTLETKLKAVESQAEGVKPLKANVLAVQSTLASLKQRVAFDVWHSTNPLHTPGNGTLILNHAAVNIGGAYDVSTGVFTVPIAGLYNFQASIMAYKGTVKSVYAGLYVDSTMYGEMVADSGHGYWDQSTVRALVHLVPGQTVYLKNVSATAAYYSATNQPYTTFSGFLIQADC